MFHHGKISLSCLLFRDGSPQCQNSDRTVTAVCIVPSRIKYRPSKKCKDPVSRNPNRSSPNEKLSFCYVVMAERWGRQVRGQCGTSFSTSLYYSGSRISNPVSRIPYRIPNPASRIPQQSRKMRIENSFLYTSPKISERRRFRSEFCRGTAANAVLD